MNTNRIDDREALENAETPRLNSIASYVSAGLNINGGGRDNVNNNINNYSTNKYSSITVIKLWSKSIYSFILIV
jgi:hypothetical protein